MESDFLFRTVSKTCFDLMVQLYIHIMIMVTVLGCISSLWTVLYLNPQFHNLDEKCSRTKAWNSQSAVAAQWAEKLMKS